ncbi:MAG: alpha-(1-2)-phosphatidylinositol mannosyltransferase, partial [Micrococcales bacterium]
VPGAKAAMRRVGEVNDVVTFLTEYTRRRIARAFTPAAAARMQRLTSGVDASQFRPGVGREEIRRRYGLGDRPVVVCVSRLVPRKGQDMLIRALPMVRRRIGDVALLLVGEGPDDGRLRDLAERTGVRRQVFFAGRAPWGELSMHLAAGDVFAMPARTRHHGFDVEGLGICYLEAAAVELPVVAGDSGGAGEAVLDGRTGFVVDGGDPAVIADRLGWLLANPDQATAMGRAGRRWVQQRWRPQDQAQALARLLGQT